MRKAAPAGALLTKTLVVHRRASVSDGRLPLHLTWCRDWSAGRTSLLQPTSMMGTVTPRRRSSGIQKVDTLRKVCGFSMLKHSTMTLAS